MSKIPFDTIAFDLDGTLADTAPDIRAALNHALETLGRNPVGPDAVRDMIGDGARALIRRALAATGEASEELVDRAFPLYIEHYASNICEGTRLYPGIEKALDELKAEGLKIAVCTNKPEALTHQLLDALGWSGGFDSIVGGDTLPVRKPDPAPLHEAIRRSGGGRAAFVGDSITDADTARAAGLPFVAVSFGFRDRPVEQLGAAAIIDQYDELIPALRRL